MSTATHKSKQKKGPQTSFDHTLSNVSHLMRRAGFGDTQANLLTAALAGLEATIGSLVDYEQVQDNFAPPDPSVFPTDKMKNQRIEPLTQWWLQRMITTSRPLQEKMVLFWHGHFATANYKVAHPEYMYQQNQLFRTNALGSFDDLLLGIYKDPAMLIWLDGQRNTRLAPNENYGREVMELFTLGRATGDAPNYTEDDVHANARAFTGWRLDLTGNAVFNPRLHDDTVKTVLGQTGNWGGDDVSHILAAHPATARFLSTKLWQFFASDNPPTAVIDRMAAAYTNSNHSVRETVRTMFSAPEFYSQDARANHIKSPTDFLVSIIKHLGITTVDTTTFPRILQLLGQELFNPVNVGGWPGGPNWINASTMLGRFNFVSRLTGNAPGSKGILDGQAILAASQAETVSQLVYYIVDMLGIPYMSADTELSLLRYAGRGLIDSIDGATKAQGLVHLAIVSPEYQIA